MCDRDGYISACLQEAFLESLLKDHELQILLNNVMALRGSTPMHAPRSATIVNRGTAVSMPGQPAGRLRTTAATAEATSAAALGTSAQQSDTGSCRQLGTHAQPARQREQDPDSVLPSDMLRLPVGQRVKAFWQARRAAVSRAVDSLYHRHVSTDPRETATLAALFMDLPANSPVRPESYNLTLEQVFGQELAVWKQRSSESASYTGTMVDAWNSQLGVVKLLPHFLAVVCLFAERSGIAREFPFAFLLTMAP